MLAQLDQLESQLKTLLEALRRSGEQLNDGLARLQEQVSDFAGRRARAGWPSPSRLPEPEPVVAAEPPSRNGDEAGARLIALNMALSGTPRAETAAYLAEHYDLADADALLDDVYSQVGQ